MTSDSNQSSDVGGEPAEQVRSAPHIFLSYRRDDTGDVAKVLSERLREDVGSRNVFRDEENLIAGQRWADALTSALDGSDAAVLIIGQGWVGVASDGSRRIDDVDDPVRNEVVHALRSDTRSEPIPVLVDVDSLPELPEALKSLKDRHFVQVDRATVADTGNGEYQGVLVGVWEALRLHHPGGVLIIGEDRARGALDQLVVELQDTNAIDATALSRFAAGACLVTPKRARKGARKWPDVIFVAEDDSPSELFKARVVAAYHNDTVRSVAVVGAGAAAIGALLGGAAAAAAGAAPAASVASYATGSQLAAAVPNAGTGLAGSISAAWSGAATGTQIAVAAGVVAASVAAVASTGVVIGNIADDTDVQIAFPANATLAALADDDERFFPLGVPGDVGVSLGSPVPTDETGPFPSDDYQAHEVILDLPGGDPVSLGTIALPETVPAESFADLDDGRYRVVNDLVQDVTIQEGAVPVEDFCFDRADPSDVVGGWLLTGPGGTSIVRFLAIVEDGEVTDTVIEVTLEGEARRELLAELPEGFDLSECPENRRDVIWSS